MWGFDEDAVKALRRMCPKPVGGKKTDKSFEILLNSDAKLAKHGIKPVSFSMNNNYSKINWSRLNTLFRNYFSCM